MVATRKSISTQETAADADAGEQTPSKRQLAALKKLHIDAHGAILDGKAANTDDNKKVYHYRGSTYEISGTEPEDWITQQPERYKKQASVASTSPEKAATTLGSRKRQHVDDTPDTNAQSALKRARTAMAKPAGKPTPRDYAYETVVVDERDPFYTSRVFDFTRVGGQEPMSCSQARALARSRGLTVNPFSQSEIDYGRTRNALTTVRHMDTLTKKAAKYAKQYQRLQREMAYLETATKQPPTSNFTPPASQNTAADTPSLNSGSSDLIITRILERPGAPPPDIALDSPFDADKPLTESTPERVYRSKTPRSAAELPSTDKGGNALRWTIDMEKLNQQGRAEAAICMGRLPGESQAAKRRRVKRELEVVRGWQFVGEADQKDAQ